MNACLCCERVMILSKWVHEIDNRCNPPADNGWWELDEEENKVYNYLGGWHFYHPDMVDNVIIGDWDDVKELILLNPEAKTGWLAPDGTWYPCNPWNHSRVSYEIFGHFSEAMTEQQGYVKISKESNIILSNYPGEKPYFAISTKPITDAQMRYLSKREDVNLDMVIL